MAASPIIDGRDRVQILGDLLSRALAYVPEWSVASNTPAYAFLAILARDIEVQAAAENGMPDAARLAFLSTLGNSLLPAQSARTPLMFQLMANAPLDVTLAANSEVAAKLPPPPSLLGAKQAAAVAPIFSTEGTITLTRAVLTALYSVDPNADTYADHTQALTAGFTLFDRMQPVPHQLYLGHDSLFALSARGRAVVRPCRLAYRQHAPSIADRLGIFECRWLAAGAPSRRSDGEADPGRAHHPPPRLRPRCRPRDCQRRL